MLSSVGVVLNQPAAIPSHLPLHHHAHRLCRRGRTGLSLRHGRNRGLPRHSWGLRHPRGRGRPRGLGCSRRPAPQHSCRGGSVAQRRRRHVPSASRGARVHGGRRRAIAHGRQAGLGADTALRVIPCNPGEIGDRCKQVPSGKGREPEHAARWPAPLQSSEQAAGWNGRGGQRKPCLRSCAPGWWWSHRSVASCLPTHMATEPPGEVAARQGAQTRWVGAGKLGKRMAMQLLQVHLPERIMR